MGGQEIKHLAGRYMTHSCPYTGTIIISILRIETFSTDKFRLCRVATKPENASTQKSEDGFLITYSRGITQATRLISNRGPIYIGPDLPFIPCPPPCVFSELSEGLFYHKCYLRSPEMHRYRNPFHRQSHS